MDDAAAPVNLSLTGAIAFEKGVSVLQAAELIRYLEAPSSEAPSLVDERRGADHGDSRKPAQGTPRQALTESGASTNPEKIVALALHLLADGSDETFKVSQVKAAFERARETVPRNFTRDLSTAVRNGWIVESGSAPGSYYVTHDGEQALTHEFGRAPKSTTSTSEGAKTRKPTKRAARRRTAVTVPPVFAEMDEIPQQIDGVPRYSEMKSAKDRLLWALYMAKHLGLEGLDNKSIVWATDHLGSGISGKHVGVYFEYNRKNNFANTSLATKLKRITVDGERYLRALVVEP